MGSSSSFSEVKILYGSLGTNKLNLEWSCFSLAGTNPWGEYFPDQLPGATLT